MESEHLFSRFAPPQAQPDAAPSEEVLVTDVRAGLTPAQMVERKLISLLASAPPPPGGRFQAASPQRPLP